MFYLEVKHRGRVRHYPLADGVSFVGRGSACEVRLEDTSLSRRHFRLELQQGRCTIADLGSTNGTWVDGRRIDSESLAPDRWVSAGESLIALRAGLSLSPIDTPAGNGAPVAADGEEPSTVPPSREPSKDEWALLAELADCLDPERSEEERVQALTRLVGERTGADSARLYVRHAATWSLAAQWGRPLTSELEALATATPLPNGGERRRLRLCLGELETSGGGACRLALHPVPGREGCETARRLTASILRLARPSIVGPADDQQAPMGAAPSASDEEEPAPFIAVSETSRRVLEQIDRLAAADLPVVLHGESGTGKELLARRLHHRSKRSAEPFLALNCAALPQELLEAELFGIERGVATGVSGRTGKLVLASGGTFFLDEVADLPAAIQPKLLRALESLHVTPLGSNQEIPVNVRLIAASHQDLDQAVREGRFRSDLYYRLAGAIVPVPPLRERPEEILPLARRFARQAAEQRGIRFGGISLDAARALMGHHWPGNVRELRHAIERAVALADGPILHSSLLPGEVTGGADPGRGDLLLSLRGEWRPAREAFDRFYFSDLLQRAGGNLSRAAREAGLSRSYLYQKLEELGLREDKDGGD